MRIISSETVAPQGAASQPSNSRGNGGGGKAVGDGQAAPKSQRLGALAWLAAVVVLGVSGGGISLWRERTSVDMLLTTLAEDSARNDTALVDAQEVTKRLSLFDSTARARLSVDGDSTLTRNSTLARSVEEEKHSPPPGVFSRIKQRVDTGLETVRRNVFQVSEVQVAGNTRLQEAYVFRIAGLKRDAAGAVVGDLLDMPLKRVSRLLKQSPWVEDVQLSVSYFPSTLHIRIREAEPWLVVYMGGKTWLVSTLGHPLEALETLRDDEVILQASELPRLEGIDGGSQQAINARFRYAINILRLIEVAGGLPFAVDRYRLLEEGGVVATPAAGVNVPEVMLGAGDLSQAEETLQKLKVVLEDLTQRGETRAQVDMRFTGQAVVR